MDYHTWGWGTLKARMGNQVALRKVAQLLAPLARCQPFKLLINASGELVLSDIGIAKIREGEGGSVLTGMRTGLGTPEYWSPE
jgi:hypothetical protein